MELYKKQREQYQTQIRKQRLQDRVLTSRQHSLRKQSRQREEGMKGPILETWAERVQSALRGKDKLALSRCAQEMLKRPQRVETPVDLEGMMALTEGDNRGTLEVLAVLTLLVQTQVPEKMVRSLVRRMQGMQAQSSTDKRVLHKIAQVMKGLLEQPCNYQGFREEQGVDKLATYLAEWVERGEFSFERVGYLQTLVSNQQYLDNQERLQLSDILSTAICFYSQKHILQFQGDIYALDVCICAFQEHSLSESPPCSPLALSFLHDQLRHLAEYELDTRDNRQHLWIILAAMSIVIQSTPDPYLPDIMPLLSFVYLKSPSTRPQHLHLQCKTSILEILSVLLPLSIWQSGVCLLMLQDHLSSYYSLRHALSHLLLQLVTHCSESNTPQSQVVMPVLLDTLRLEREHDIRLTTIQTVFHYAKRHPAVMQQLRDGLPPDPDPEITYWTDQLDCLESESAF